MDPSKPASAPPLEWTGEKSNMGHSPPPPYQDYPYPAHPQPGPGYPPLQQGYGPPPPQYGCAVGQQHYPGQPETYTVQPTVFVTRVPLTNPVNDYLCYSIFTLVCCCMPLGIAALIYSISTREANYSGNQMAAERSSKMARTLNHVGLGLGIGVIILTIVYVVFMASVY